VAEHDGAADGRTDDFDDGRPSAAAQRSAS
jgi:hypothetical protein